MGRKRVCMTDMAKTAAIYMRVARAPRAWIYCRVAHNGPDSAELLAVQRHQLETYAKENGFEIVGSSSDIGSGLTFDRPGLLDFLDAMEDEAVDVFLLPDLSRLGRDIDKVIQYWHLLHGRGVHIYTAIDGEIDLSINAMIQKVVQK